MTPTRSLRRRATAALAGTLAAIVLLAPAGALGQSPAPSAAPGQAGPSAGPSVDPALPSDAWAIAVCSM